MPKRAHRVGARPDRGRQPAGRPDLRRRRRPRPLRGDRRRAAIGSCRTSGAGAASPSTTCTSTSWAAARSNGRPAEPLGGRRWRSLLAGVRRCWRSRPPSTSARARSGRAEGPTRTVGPVVAQTRADLVRALGDARTSSCRTRQAPFRPPEDARFTTTPAGALPGDPARRRRRRASSSSTSSPIRRRPRRPPRAQAAYLATGPAKVQSPFGARHIIRLVGPTVVMYSWVPGGRRGPAPAGHPDGARDARHGRAGPVLRSRPASPAASDRQRTRRGPRPDRVALDLERVGPREVLARPQPPAGDPLVRAEASRSRP